jgi:hypothetical protein
VKIRNARELTQKVSQLTVIQGNVDVRIWVENIVVVTVAAGGVVTKNGISVTI